VIVVRLVGITAVAVGAVACGAGSASPVPVTSPVAATATPDPNAPEVVTAGDIPDNQVYVPYRAPDGGFEVAVPQGWARGTDGTATVFTDKFNTVRIEAAARPTAVDAASARAQEVPKIATTPSFALGDVTTVTRKAGRAVLITYTAASTVDPVTGKSVLLAVERYEFWRSGREVVLTLSGAKGADNVDPWRTVTDSFRWRP
jgi:hypothetical protein